MAGTLFKPHLNTLTSKQDLKTGNENKTSENSFDFPLLARVTSHDYATWYRFLWATILVTCWILCAYQTWERISYYRSSPIGTSVTMIRNQTLHYPMMAACTTSTSGYMHLREALAKELQRDKCDFAEVEFVDNVEDILNMTFDQIMEKVGLERDLDQCCYLEPVPYSMYEALCILSSSRSLKGPCVTLSSRYTPDFGPHNVFQLRASIREKFCYPSNLWILIHDDMFDIVWKAMFEVDFIQMEYLPGTGETIPLSVAEFTYLNTKSNTCTDSGSYNRCFLKYFDDSVKKANLSCTTPELGGRNLKACSTFAEMREMEKKLNGVFKPNESPCPRKCHQTIYRRSYGRKTKEASSEYSIGIEYLDNIISLSKEYYLYSFISLLCDLGGNIGLFLGICLMSVFETLDAWCKQFLRRIT